MASAPAIIDPPASDPPASDPPAAAPPANDGGDPPASDPPAADPVADDWRTRLSGGDEKLTKYLARVPSEKALVEQFKKHHDDIKQGKYLKPLGDAPTDEELAAYRAAIGVPEKPEGYMEKLPDGLVVGDDDKPFVDVFLSEMHAANAPPGLTNAALKAYYGIVEEQAAAQAEAETAAKNESIEALREEWGTDYKRNTNIVRGYLETLPEPVAGAFREGRDANGLPLANNADVIRWLAAQAMEANPVATVVPGAGANQASAIADELAALRAEMGNRQGPYWKGPLAEKKQARFIELIEAEQKLKARG